MFEDKEYNGSSDIILLVIVLIFAVSWSIRLAGIPEEAHEMIESGVQQLNEEIIKNEKHEFEITADGFSKKIRANKSISSDKNEKEVYVVSNSERYAIKDDKLVYYVDGKIKNVFTDWEICELD